MTFNYLEVHARKDKKISTVCTSTEQAYPIVPFLSLQFFSVLTMYVKNVKTKISMPLI